MSNSFSESSTVQSPDATTATRKWRPLTRAQRRVIGVLVEKAKTTPDAYPMSLNALTTGCNQKSNRSPLMNLQPEEVQEVVDQLRELGAVAEVQSGGRVPKYKHYMYEWLDVDKYEISVMTELLLRGEQTVGELRTRASRMEPIADLTQLRPILDSLVRKNLLVELEPPGRGQMVTHNLYEPRELEAIKQRSASAPSAQRQHATSSHPAPSASDSELGDLRELVEQLRDEVQQLRDRLEQLEERVPI